MIGKDGRIAIECVPLKTKKSVRAKWRKAFGTFIVPILAGIAAAVVTTNPYVGLSVILLGVIYQISLLVAFVPILGVTLWWIGMNWITPAMTSTFHIPISVMWIVSLMWWFDYACGWVLTICVSGFLFFGILNRSRPKNLEQVDDLIVDLNKMVKKKVFLWINKVNR